MPGVDEAVALATTQLQASLKAGVKTLSLNQEITFTKYTKTVLPLDGYLFWVKNSPPSTVTVQGSLHFASDNQQQKEEVYTVNRVLFTSLEFVEQFNQIDSDTLWIGEFTEEADGSTIRFAFNSRSYFYQQSGLHHYVGNAIYADMTPQVLDVAPDASQVIVSNSLPLWLLLNGFVPPFAGTGFANPVTLYPAMLSPQNLEPPFGTVDIRDGVEALTSAPLLGSDSSHTQAVTEFVTITLWGLNNAKALQFVDCVLAYTLNFGTFGIMNVPIIRDEQRGQPELNTLAQKKVVTFQVSYDQYTVRSTARGLIVKASAAYLVKSA